MARIEAETIARKTGGEYPDCDIRLANHPDRMTEVHGTRGYEQYGGIQTTIEQKTAIRLGYPPAYSGHGHCNGDECELPKREGVDQIVLIRLGEDDERNGPPKQ